jgi:pheromone shutdown protein TraB
LLFAGLEFSVFARIMVQVLLYERNEILARNILHQCKLSSGNGKKNVSKGSGNAITDMLSFFSGSADDDAASVTEELKGTTGTDAFETFYVPGGTASVQVINTADTGKVVLAVLGMAHCNGIVKLLKEELVD